MAIFLFMSALYKRKMENSVSVEPIAGLTLNLPHDQIKEA